MKPMTQAQIIVAGATTGDVEKACAVFESAYRESCAWILDGITAGRYRANTVFVNHRREYVVIWHKNDQGAMHVNALAQLNTGGFFPEMIAALKEICRDAGCHAIQGLTVRAGLVKKLCEHGFRAAGVTMIYDVS